MEFQQNPYRGVVFCSGSEYPFAVVNPKGGLLSCHSTLDFAMRARDRAESEGHTFGGPPVYMHRRMFREVAALQPEEVRAA